MTTRWCVTWVCVMLIAWGHPACAKRSKSDASEDPLSVALSGVVQRLMEGVPAKPEGGRWRVAIDDMLHRDVHLPSPLSRHLRDRLGTQMQTHFEVVARDTASIRRAQREIHATMKDEFDQASRVEAGHFLGYEALLQGTYQVFEQQVFVHVRMVHPLTLRVLAQADAWLSRRDLPRGLSVEPDVPAEQKRQIAVFDAAPASADTSLRIEVWPDLGDGATYRQGDLLYVRFRASRDGYLRLYHRDESGVLRYLYPKPPGAQKRIRAGVIYTIPDSTYGRRWRVGPPYGIDIIKAIASTVPFTDLPQETFEGEVRLETVRGIVERGLSEEGVSAEATCVFRTRAR